MDLGALERATADAGRERERVLHRTRRRERGIVHTPPELARAVVRLADEALQREVGLVGGLADARLTLVDPACGPGAFLAAALAVAEGRPTRPRAVWGFDLDAAALDVARAQVGAAFASADWPLVLRHLDTLATESLLDEVAGAGPIAILGNPPWRAGPRALPAAHMRVLLEEFRRTSEGGVLAEKKLGVLADAYVRFVCWALACVRRAGGVFALVTNGSFLDGAVHRGMREVLCRHLDRLDIVDLGGNAMLTRGAVRDENVMGVRPSVAVLVGARRATSSGGGARIRYQALRGRATDKLDALAAVTPETLRPLVVRPPQRRFVVSRAAPARYAAWPSLAEAMPFHREGVQTNRDAVATDADRARLLARLHAFANDRPSVELVGARRRLRHYDPERARAAVADALARDPRGERGLSVAPIAYRVFDVRWFAPISPLCHRPRGELLRAMAHAPLALVTVRKDRGHAPWSHFGAVAAVPDSSYLSTRSSCRTRAFPVCDPEGRENLALDVAARVAERAGRPISARSFLHYALAVLAAPAYRARFDDELRADYPRIPWPVDRTAFDALERAGDTLARLLSAPRAQPRPVDTCLANIDRLLDGAL